MGNNHSNTKTTLLISENSEKNQSNAEKNSKNDNAQLTQFTQKPQQKPDTSTSKTKHQSDTERVTSSGDNVITDVGAKHKLSTSSNTTIMKEKQTQQQTTQRVFLELSNILQAEQYAGILNAGNTCYLSSVLQALYACAPFRERVLSYSPLIKNNSAKSTNSNNGHNITNSSPSDFSFSQQTNSLDRRLLKNNKHKIHNGTIHKSGNYTQQQLASLKNRTKHNSGPPPQSNSSSSTTSINNPASIQSSTITAKIKSYPINSTSAATKINNNNFNFLQNIPISNITPQQLQSILLKTKANQSSLVKNNFHKRQLLKLHSDNLLTALHHMYLSIYETGSKTKRKKPGKYDARKFIHKFHSVKEQFANYMQHDAHEFFGCLLDALHEILEAEAIIESLAKIEFLENSSVMINSGQSVDGLLSIDQNMTSSVNSNYSQSNNSEISFKKDKKKSSSIFSKFKKKKKHKNNKSNTEINQLENLDLTDAVSFKSESTEPEPRNLDNSENNNNDPPIFEQNDPPPSWIQKLFGGTLVNETRCLTCHAISSKEEKFLDLSVDIEADSSLLHCLQTFCTTETLTGDQKYFCENCGCKVEAHKRMRIKSLPKILCIQLKRFKFQESLGNFVKLSSRVSFPEQLRVDDLMQKDDKSAQEEEEEDEQNHTSKDNLDPVFQLVSLVIHCGQGPNRGHYIAACRIAEERFLVLDDDLNDVHTRLDDFYGIRNNNDRDSSVDVVNPSNQTNSAETAYILFYQQLERQS